ncbi:MAG: RICIN domain-containing protein [Clostridia bacterium]|nr:RICIN domain-containing protein [Clostridia bacterium]
MKRWIHTLTALVLALALLLPAVGCAETDAPEGSQPESAAESSLAEASAEETSAEDTDGTMADVPVGTTDGVGNTATTATSGRVPAGTTKSTTRTTAVSDEGDDFVFEEEWVKPGATTVPEEEESLPTPSGDPEILGVGYDHKKDSFYQKERIRVTWLNVWNGSTEFWWADLAKTTSVNGIKMNINGTYTCMDSNNSIHRKAIATAAFEAGIDALAMDLTNGYAGWRSAASGYQRLCYENGKKFTVAVHPTDATSLEQMCRMIWLSYAGPGMAAYSSAYLYKDGKPLMILYCTAGEFAAATSATSTYAKKFTFHWASGEDSQKDKWGWQIEPQDGPMASEDSMFITPSVNWNSPQGHSETWRSSLAMLDFCFLAATEYDPQFWVIGSMDDMFERNGWMKMDTTNAFYQTRLDPDPTLYVTSGKGLQLRDVNGAVSTDVYYERVKSWNTGTVKPYYAGGLLADGAYTLKNVQSGKGFGVIRPNAHQANDVGAAFYPGRNLTTDMETYYWFYHLGNNVYRIIKLSSGLSLEDENGTLVQKWTDTTAAQKWKVTRQSDGSYRLVNQATGRILQESGDSICVLDAASTSANWTLTAVKNRTIP